MNIPHCESEPLVSCVIIFLNGETFIGEAIESVLAQTVSDWELILVDDGTTDGATEIVRRYCASHPDRIRLISHPGGRNMGMSASRNAGVRASRGRYLAFIDADDIWLPERLETHVEMFERHPEAALVIGPTLRWSSWAKADAPWWRPWATLDERQVLGLVEDVLLDAPGVATHFLERHGAGMPPPCCVTMRRDVIEAVRGSEDRFRTLYEDQVLFFKFFLEQPIVATGRMLDLYRLHSESTCAVAGWEAGDRAARPAFLAWLQAWIEERDIRDPALRSALAAEIARAKVHSEPGWRPGWARRMFGFWHLESRQAAIWCLGAARFNRLRGRFGLTPLANELETLIPTGGRPQKH